MSTVLALLITFALGWFGGLRWERAGNLVDQALHSILGPPDPERPAWVLEEDHP